MVLQRNLISQLVESARSRFLGTAKSSKKSADLLYEGKDFLDGYIAHTNKRVSEDPHRAIGGLWDEIGELQFNFLVQVGLKPEHRLLDLGCGTLRGGRHFVNYLDRSNYTGIDISPACIDAARQLVVEESLEDKAPNLILATSKAMDFKEVEGQNFDYILAQSVFTHLPEQYIEACFDHVRSVMQPSSKFYFTYFEAETSERRKLKDFAYPKAYFIQLAEDFGFHADDLADRYQHPRDQKMMCIRLKSPSID